MKSTADKALEVKRFILTSLRLSLCCQRAYYICNNTQCRVFVMLGVSTLIFLSVYQYNNYLLCRRSFQGFIAIQTHQDRCMAIVVRSDFSKTISVFNLDRWSKSSRELQGIRIENQMRDTYSPFSSLQTSTLLPASQGQVEIFLRRWKGNWETHS